MDTPLEYKRNIYRALLVLMVILSLYFVVRLGSELKAYNLMGASDSHTITMTGHGEVSAVPDIASVNFTITRQAKTVQVAQQQVTEVETKALTFLKESGVEEKDIKTANVSYNPQYSYVNASGVPCPNWNCPGGKQVIIGYEASESVTVKVRKTDDAGKIIEGLGVVGVTNLNGPDFTIDDEDELKGEARRQAIAEAKEKAEALAKDLGVKLGRVSSFSESGNFPIYYAKDARMATEGMATNQASAPQLPTGENLVTVDVTITYEIR